MDQWTPAQDLPSQMADAFAVLYDWCATTYANVVENKVWMHAIHDDRRLVTLSKQVAESDWDTPWPIHDVWFRARTSGEERDLAVGAYLCLLAIDRGFRDHLPIPRLGGLADSGGRLLDHWEEYGHFNVETTGYVLPKWTSAFRGTYFSEHFRHLVRANVTRDQVLLIRRSSRTHFPRRTTDPSVTVVPFLYTFDDARFTGVEREEQHHFRVDHNSEALGRLEERVRAAVRAARESGATVAIFPELVLNEHLLGVLRRVLLATDSRKATLDWVIAGTYLGAEADDIFPVNNAAVVLDSSGNVVQSSSSKGEKLEWIRRKRHRYKLTRAEQGEETYDITSFFDAPYDREEAIAVGHQLIAFEERGRRHALLICEDWAHEQQTCHEVAELGCSSVYVVLMDGPVATGRWSIAQAREFTARTGASAIIANSLLLPNRPNSLARSPVKDGKLTVGMVVHPQERDVPQGAPPIEMKADAKPAAADESLVSSPQPITPILPVPEP